MAMSTRARLDTLENALKELAYAGRRMEMSVEQLLQEMREFKDSTRHESRRMNEQWGALANKMGTFVEDIVLPNFPRILERYFGIAEVDDMLVSVASPIRRIGRAARSLTSSPGRRSSYSGTKRKQANTSSRLRAPFRCPRRSSTTLPRTTDRQWSWVMKRWTSPTSPRYALEADSRAPLRRQIVPAGRQ